MKINEEEWKEATVFPPKDQKCKVLIVKEMVYTGSDHNGHHTWQEDKHGEHRIVAWKPMPTS